MSAADAVMLGVGTGAVLGIIAALNAVAQGSRLATALYVLSAQVWLAAGLVASVLGSLCK